MTPYLILDNGLEPVGVRGKMARIARVVVPGMPHHITQRGEPPSADVLPGERLRALSRFDGGLVPALQSRDLVLLPDAQSRSLGGRAEVGRWSATGHR